MQKSKFMQSLETGTLKELRKVAKNRGVTVQELIRVAIVPDYLYGPIRFDAKTRRRILNGSSGKLR